MRNPLSRASFVNSRTFFAPAPLAAALLMALLAAAPAPAPAQQDAAVQAAPAAQAPAAAPQGAVDPEAVNLLRAMPGSLAALTSYRATLVTSTTLIVDDFRDEEATRTALRVRRPDRLAIETTDGQFGGSAFASSDTLLLSFAAKKKFVKLPGLGPIDSLLDDGILTMTGGDSNAMGFVLTLLGPRAAENFLDRARAAKFLGADTVAGVACHKAVFETGNVAWTLWVTADGKFLPRRIQVDFTGAVRQRAAEMGQSFQTIRGAMTLDFEDSQANPALDDDAFAYVPPTGFTQARSLERAFMEIHPLEGKPAPDVELPLLGGGKIKISEYKGKNILILDFWATWCSPCVRAMPIITEVAGQFKDKGVLLFAINSGEEEAKIREFIKEHNITATVALDPKNEASRLYQAEAIPQTVIIDREGMIQVVHSGIGPNTRRELIQEIETLLAGKSLLTTP